MPHFILAKTRYEKFYDSNQQIFKRNIGINPNVCSTIRQKTAHTAL
ncbi:hypothetical protein SAMN04488056_10356 [Cohaesibacter marisflavi]|uniref:Uncharacterized protein n=1 Tax=Cohaesibacter marisflavi TaxID=655353 RepID=A0A1I5E6M0_9HYPH|nr:hypothetical protein SAMN04488056_10356 [Cohaesibacter marisflavi]